MVRDGNRNGKKKRSNVDEKAESAELLPSAAAGGGGKVPTKGRLSTSTTRDSRGEDANNKVTHRSRTAAKSVFTVDEKPSKPKPGSTRPATSNPYLAGVDLPPSESDSDDDDDEAAERRRSRPTVDLKAAALSKKDALRKDRREAEAAARAEAAKRDALRDNLDAFAVTIRGRAPGGPAAAGAAADNVRDIVLEDFDVSVEGVPLFVGASLRVLHGRRYGLVGPNGKGKSALLKLLAEGRKLPVPRGIRSTLVAQEDKNDDPRPVIEVVLSADEELARLRAERAELEGSGDAARLAEVYEELTISGWDSATAWASKILAGLGFDQEKQARPASSFSGGWVKRITLAGALFVQPTLLLLDEPTNHLDLRAVLWLEEYLVARCKSTVIVVSHDQDFLNSVCDEIIHVHDKKLDAYRGNFDDFEKAARKSRRRMPSKTRRDDYSVEFHFPAPDELPRRRPLLQLSEAGFRYPDFTLSGVDVDVYMGTRAAIVGPNGAGKSTLLKLLSGELSPTQGKVRTHHKLRTGRYSQRFVDTLKLHQTAVQHLLEAHPDLDGDEAEASAALAEFGLPSESHLTPINRLSGGQKARVVLASMALEEPHMLLLDEPTNHLDMQTIDALADALCEFAGGVVLVSHDSRLISRVCEDEESSEVWVVQDGTVSTYHGTFEEYKEELIQEIREEVQG